MKMQQGQATSNHLTKMQQGAASRACLHLLIVSTTAQALRTLNVALLMEQAA
jgi:hypothetical protein